MTTYEQLWSDINFIDKRILEQEFYIVRLLGKFQNNEITEERWKELDESAMFILNKFDKRLTELLNASKIKKVS